MSTETVWDETRKIRWVQEHHMEYAIFRKADTPNIHPFDDVRFESFLAARLAIELGYRGGTEYLEVRARPSIRWKPATPEIEAT